MQFLRDIIFGGSFLPHGYCYLWTPGLVALHVVSDTLIAISYFSIPIALVHFIRKRKDVPFSWIFLLFGGFIVACGGTHLMEVWTIWFSSYWLAGIIKAVTACLSVVTAVMVVRVMPRALALPGTRWLVELNQKLTVEVEQRTLAESGLRRLTEELELRVAERTAELSATNRSLRESEERYRTLVDYAPEAIIVLDMDKRKFTDMNKNSERLFGMSRAELLQVGPVEVSPPFQPDGRSSKEAAMAEIEKCLSHETPRFEWIHLNSEGKQIPCEISLVRLPSSGRNLLRASLVDISARKRAEEEIRALNSELENRVRERTGQLEAANHDLESFSYSVSHDLRAPLRHVDGFSRILLEEFGSQIPYEALRHLERIRESTLHMGCLIDDLLNLARVGRKPLTIRSVNLNDIVLETITRVEADLHGQIVDWRVAPLSPVECDGGLIQQVFLNLLSNALKFSRLNEKSIVEIGEMLMEGAPVIFVRDYGVGFDPRQADKMFQVFQRFHSDDEFEGTGVGLAIVQRIIQKHGGSIWAESEPRKGATFYFSIGREMISGTRKPGTMESLTEKSR